MPLTLRERTLLQWNSHLGSAYRRRKALAGWQQQLYSYAFYSLACLLLFDRMLLGCCTLSCSSHLITKHGANVLCQSSGAQSTVSELCDCLRKTPSNKSIKSEEDKKEVLKMHHLEFCADILPLEKHLAVLANAAQCTETFLRIVRADCTALQDNIKFEEIISRIDCADRYSVRWDCKDCKVSTNKTMLCVFWLFKSFLSCSR